MNGTENDYKVNSYIITLYDSSGEIKSRATAFAITSQIIITAEHFIKECDGASYILYLSADDYAHQNGIFLTHLYSDDKYDFALFNCAPGVLPLSIDIGICDLKEGDEVFGYGYPLEKRNLPSKFHSEIALDLRTTSSTDYCYEIMQCKKNLISNYQGISGSPLYYKSSIVGIVLFQQKNTTLYCVSFESIIPRIIEKTKLAIDVSSKEEIDYIPMETPEAPFHVVHEINNLTPSTKGLGVNFSFNQWNEEEFSEIACEWLAEYVIPSNEWGGYKNKRWSANKLAKKHFKVRNDNLFLDLLLHIAIRKNYKTIPIVNKIFSIDDEVVPSCSHVVVNKGKVELWLGSSSFNTSASDAIKQVTDILVKMITLNNLSERYAIIINKADKDWPQYEKLKDLGNNSIPLNKRVDKIILPVFICYEDAIISNYNEERFESEFIDSMNLNHKQFINCYNHGFIEDINVRLFIFPLGNFENLMNSFMKVLND